MAIYNDRRLAACANCRYADIRKYARKNADGSIVPVGAYCTQHPQNSKTRERKAQKVSLFHACGMWEHWNPRDTRIR